MNVFVTILPQAEFVGRVGGDRVRVQVLVGPGQSYHTYEPTPRQIAELADARAYFTIGVPFEQLLIKKVRAAAENLIIVDARQGLPLRMMEEAEEGQHHAGHAHHGQEDPHVWLDPRLVKRMTRAICDALQQIDPSHNDEYEHNLSAYHRELDDLHRELTRALAPLAGREFFVYHPAYGYFADAYGLKQVAVEEAGKEPTARRVAALIERARASGVRLIFVQPQFASSGARTVAEAIGGAVLPLDPLARDYVANMREMGRRIGEAVRTAQGPQAAAAEGRP
jgi:zinc transport system substrate-binding protein